MIRPNEPKPKGSNFWEALISRFPLTVAILTYILGSLFGLLLALAVFCGISHFFVSGQWKHWVEVAFVLGLFFFSLFCLWLIGR